jgi:hypothetical protein
MFRISGRVPVEELNTSFRELVKKYHPDKVREHPDWAHERMAEINDAYETLAEWITRPPVRESVKKSEPDSGGTRTPEGSESTPDDSLFRKEIPPLTADLEGVFYPVFNHFLDGLGVYYQYGLENPAYRGEGVRRFRFREALRNVQKGRDKLEQLSRSSNHPIIASAARFARLTVAEINLGEPVLPERMTCRKFDDRLRSARRSFDDAVKEFLFPELIPKHLRGRAAAGLYACYTAFVLYVTVFQEGERRDIGILMTARYDALMDLMELRNAGLLRI